MKYSMMMNLVGAYLGHLIAPKLPGKQQEIKKEYKKILLRASDIGSSNRLLSSYLLASYFIAMNRKDGLTPEENIEILESRMRGSKALKLFMGDAKGYFSEKAMAGRREWSRETHDEAHKKQYPNDWVVDVVEKAGDFQFGFNYLECGVCKLCRDEGCPELAKYLCRLDFMLVELIGIGLRRTTVLAEGGDQCDFRFLNQKEK